jgi:FKBP-type peptidyl-prolyl cis-trans isomerase (trigger factor)
MSYKLEHKFFIPRWHLDFAKYNFAQKNKIKGFRSDKIDKNLMAIIDVRYKDHIFNYLIEESTKKELEEINSKNPIVSYSPGEVRSSENDEGWEVLLVVEVQNLPEDTKKEDATAEENISESYEDNTTQDTMKNI